VEQFGHRDKSCALRSLSLLFASRGVTRALPQNAARGFWFSQLTLGYQGNRGASRSWQPAPSSDVDLEVVAAEPAVTEEINRVRAPVFVNEKER